MKKFAKFMVCIALCCSFIFTGCNLVQRNTDRYLNRTVATIGNEITITKEDLLTAYNSSGQQYVELYGYTVEKALNLVLDSLVDREILIAEAKKVIKVDETDKKVYYLTLDDDGNEISRRVIYNANVWQNEILEEVYETINSQIKNIEDKVRKELDITDETEEAEEENKYKAEEVYEKKVVYENGEWKLILPDLKPEEEPSAGFVQAETGNAEVSAKAWERYIKQLKTNEKGKNLSTVESEVLQREIDRIYEVYEGNKYVEEFETQYNINQTVSEEVNRKIVEYYKTLILQSNEKYTELGEEAGYKKYCEDMNSDSGKVYYHPYGEKFVEVSHVLIKLSDEQVAEFNALKTKLSTGEINQEEYDAEYAKMSDWKTVNVVATARDEEGKETEVVKTIYEVYQEINNELSKYSSVEEKAIAFNKYVYKYNQDEGIINKSNYYVVNLDTEVEDKMVKNFADKSRELYSQSAEGGNLSEPVFVNSSNYSGFHIIFNAGGVSSDLTLEQVRNLDSSYAVNLYNKKIMLGTEKTYYDDFYDTLTSSNYTTYTKGLIKTVKHNVKVVYYVDAYKDLY